MSSPKPYHNTGLSVHQIDLTYAGPGNYILATLQIQKIIRMGPLLQEHDSRKQHNPEELKTIKDKGRMLSWEAKYIKLGIKKAPLYYTIVYGVYCFPLSIKKQYIYDFTTYIGFIVLNMKADILFQTICL